MANIFKAIIGSFNRIVIKDKIMKEGKLERGDAIEVTVKKLK